MFKRLLAIGRGLAGQWPVPLLLVLLGAGLLLSEGDALRLRYERTAILGGEYWRLLSGQLVHAGVAHGLLNGVALLMLWSLDTELLRGWRGSALMLWLMSATALGLLVLRPDLDWYVGLSGALHGLAVVVGWRLLRARSVLGGVLLAALAAKVIAEQLSLNLGTAAIIGVPVVESAHVYGTLAGLLALPLTRAPQPSAPPGESTRCGRSPGRGR